MRVFAIHRFPATSPSPATLANKGPRTFPPERIALWHDSCCKRYKPGIDQCIGEAALIQLARAEC
jgi:hypothetical protein